MGKKSRIKKENIWEPLQPATINYSPHKDILPSYFEEKEMWKNNIYTVFVNRGLKMGGGMKFTWLSIKRNDKGTAKNWRHFQYIKNQLVGRENEGAELYPKESRLVDGSNQYHMWVLEDTSIQMPFGFNDGRSISSIPLPNGKQEPWEKNMIPDDLKEMEENFSITIEQLKKEKQKEDTIKKHFDI